MRRVFLLLILVVAGPVAAQTGFLYVFDASTQAAVLDASGHGHHLRLGYAATPDRADPVLEPDNDPGLPGDRRLRFDGKDDFAFSPTFPQENRSFTLECRLVRDAKASLFRNEVIASTRGYGGGGWELRIDSVLGTPSFTFAWYDATGKRHAVQGGTPTQLGRTYHVAVVYLHVASVSVAVLYVDGVAVGVKAVFGGQISYRGSVGLFLGNSAAGTQFWGPREAFFGTLDEVRLERRAMDAKEIAERVKRPLLARFNWGGQLRPGGRVLMGPHCPGEVNRPIAVLVSATPPSGARLPGKDGRPLPIGVDGITVGLLKGWLPGENIYTRLVDAGWAKAALYVPADPAFAGLHLWGAFAVLDPRAPHGIARLSLGAEIVLKK